MENKSPDLCNHVSLKRTGLWDGIDKETGKPIAGPMTICKQCGKKQDFTWEEWNKILPSNREGM